MVYKLLKTYLPAISISFMTIILLAGTVRCIIDKKQDNFVSFTFEVIIYLILTCVLDSLIGRINFKTYISHFLTESILIYPVTLFFAFKFRWIGISVMNLVFCSIIYFLVMIGIHFYFYYIERNCVAELNCLLKGRENKNV